LKERIQFLDAIRGYAIVMVVATHALAYTQVESSEVIQFWVQAIAVPPFFLVDGYLFLGALRRQPEFSYGDYLFKSARRLLIPWVVFTVLYGLLRAFFEYKGLLETRIILGHGIFDILNAAYYSAISAQMYFLPSLFAIRSWSFITKGLATVRPLWIVAIWVAYTIAWASMARLFGDENGLDPIFHAFWGLQFYLLGMVLHVYREVLDKYALGCAAAAVFSLLAVRSAPGAPSLVVQYLYILGVYFIIIAGVAHAVVFAALGKFTMGIFLFHAPIVIKGASMIVPVIAQGMDLLQYVLIVLLTVTVSLLVTKLITIVPYGTLLLGEAIKPR
jgi:peptidoglycan/LPS O-acetylase OafA/YrhL